MISKVSMSWRWHGLAESSAHGLSHKTTMQLAARTGVSFEAQRPHPSCHDCWQNSLPCSLLLQGQQDLLWSQKMSKSSLKEFTCLGQAHPGKSQSQLIRYLNYICKNSFTFSIQCNLSKEWRPSNSHVPSTLKGTDVYKGHWRSS